MKLPALILSILFAIPGFSQSILMPASTSFENKWIKKDSYNMNWYFIKDSSKIEVGKVSIQIIPDAKKIIIVTTVAMKNVKELWIDSTIATRFTLQPIYHSSRNMQRDMVLNFDKNITGFYYDKMKKQNDLINDTSKIKYFDSNLYPYLLSWLPLKVGYHQNISIYDYNPAGKTGALNASVKNVESGIYKTKKSGNRNVWVVTVLDDIIGEGGNVIYYFDKENRKLWKQDINIGLQKMVMETIE